MAWLWLEDDYHSGVAVIVNWNEEEEARGLEMGFPTVIFKDLAVIWETATEKLVVNAEGVEYKLSDKIDKISPIWVEDQEERIRFEGRKGSMETYFSVFEPTE